MTYLVVNEEASCHGGEEARDVGQGVGDATQRPGEVRGQIERVDVVARVDGPLDGDGQHQQGHRGPEVAPDPHESHQAGGRSDVGCRAQGPPSLMFTSVIHEQPPWRT